MYLGHQPQNQLMEMPIDERSRTRPFQYKQLDLQSDKCLRVFPREKSRFVPAPASDLTENTPSETNEAIKTLCQNVKKINPLMHNILGIGRIGFRSSANAKYIIMRQYMAYFA
jgi:hypothetical protein